MGGKVGVKASPFTSGQTPMQFTPQQERRWRNAHIQFKHPLPRECPSFTTCPLAQVMPVYYEPGTQIYGGLGYGPTHSDVANMNNKLTSKLEEVDTSDKRGFCAMSDNSMVNIDEKCRTLPHDVCASTDCCVLLGNEKCVQGDVHGPSKKGVYSDTTIKNRDLYYYKGKCYGNC